jgi:hypothetical protein
MKNFLREIQTKRVVSQNILIIILLVGFLHGLLYVFITPPWWHHDEPGHFLVARFVADHGYHPALGEAKPDDAFKNELFASFERTDFFDFVNYTGAEGEELVSWVLAPQSPDPPFYYTVAAVPLRLLKNTSLELQVYVLRLLSLSFFVLALWASWQLNGILFAESHPMRWLGTVFLALLPGFVNEMTAIGNSPLGVLFFAFFLWAGAALLDKGFSWRMLLLLGISAVACYYTNNLTWLPVIVSVPLVILFLPFRKRLKWVPWVVILFLLVLIPVILFEHDDARYWYKTNRSAAPVRLEVEQALHGDAVFALGYQDVVRQRIPENLLIARRGETLTLGFWAWASEPTQMIAPRFIFYGEEQRVVSSPAKIDLATNPTFYSFEIEIPSDSGRGMIQIMPKALDNVSPRIFLDGLLLVDGVYSQGIPQFSDKSAQSGLWGEQEFDNLLRNGSAEKTWLRPAAFLWEVFPPSITRYFRPSSLVTFQDWRGSSWYFKQTVIILNETFWGKFGPSTISMLGVPYTYRFLRVLDPFILVGAIGWGWRVRRQINWRTLAMMLLASGVLWVQFFLRGATTTDDPGTLIPWARYALPAFLPTVFLVSAGLYALFRSFLRLFGIKNATLPANLVLIFMGTLDIFALLTMLDYFYQQTQLTFFFLFVLLFLALSTPWVVGAKKESVVS